MATMGEREHRDRGMHHGGQLQVHPQRGKDQYGGGSDMYGSSGGPTASQVIAVITLLPVSGTLLGLAGLTLLGTLLGLAVTTPVFLLFSPILVPAALTLGLAVTAFLASGAFGMTGLLSLSWVVNSFRGAVGRGLPEQMDYAKHRMMDMAAYTGQKTKEAGQTIQQKAQESGGRVNY